MSIGEVVRPSIDGRVEDKIFVPDRAMFGLEVRHIPDKYINVLPQIRSTFDEDKLQELADSIPLSDIDHESGTVQYGLINPLTEAYLTPDRAQEYLDQYNLVNGTEFTLEDLSPYESPEDGVRYVIHVAGERRKKASNLRASQDWGTDGVEVVFQCAIDPSMDYFKALPYQFIENNARANPSPLNQALAIRKYHDAMKSLRGTFTKTECARAFGVRPEKVKDAIIFTDYPPAMQELEAKFGYRQTVDAHGVYEAWLLYHRQRQSDAEAEGFNYDLIAGDGRIFFESIEDLAAYETHTSLIELRADNLARSSLGSNRPKVGLDDIRDAILLRTSAPTMEELGDASIVAEAVGLSRKADGDVPTQETPAMRRRLAATKLYNMILAGLEVLDGIGELGDSRRDKLSRFGLFSAEVLPPEDSDDMLSF